MTDEKRQALLLVLDELSKKIVDLRVSLFTVTDRERCNYIAVNRLRDLSRRSFNLSNSLKHNP